MLELSTLAGARDRAKVRRQTYENGLGGKEDRNDSRGEVRCCQEGRKRSKIRSQEANDARGQEDR